jgi:hypothetical protein
MAGVRMWPGIIKQLGFPETGDIHTKHPGDGDSLLMHPVTAVASYPNVQKVKGPGIENE